MCRFLAYIGKPVLANDLLYMPQHSLINRQSLGAQEMSIPINGDGFGVSWYDFQLDDEPCQFRSVHPAWSDQNLRFLAKKIKTTSMFAHIRAATRSEERRVGKECRSRWSPYHEKKNKESSRST